MSPPQRSTAEQPFRVAVVGGGIGGLFATLCIHHQATKAGVPIKIDVYESASEYKEIGASISLGVNAARLIHNIGLGEQLNALGGVEPGKFLYFRRYDSNGEILKIPVPAEDVVKQTLCERCELLALFKRTIEERNAATLHTSKKNVKIEDLESSVRINFADSTSAEADLVVASDGIHSVTRQQFVPDKPFCSGFVAYRSLIDRNKLPDWDIFEHSNSWIAKHRHFLAYPIAPSQQISIVAFVTRPENMIDGVQESWTTHCDKQVVKDDYEGFHDAVQKIIDLMPEQVPRWRINEREPLSEWTFMNGKVALLGDAAHAMSPHLGAGAGQALEDSWILARCISDYITSAHPTLDASMKLYQNIRAPGASKTQLMSRMAGNTYELQTPEMVDKSYEECLPVLAEMTKERSRWIKVLYEQDLDEIYERIKGGMDPRTVMAMMAKGAMAKGMKPPPGMAARMAAAAAEKGDAPPTETKDFAVAKDVAA